MDKSGMLLITFLKNIRSENSQETQFKVAVEALDSLAVEVLNDFVFMSSSRGRLSDKDHSGNASQAHSG